MERAQARALAEAGAAYALAWQLDPEARKQWPATGEALDWEFGGGQVRILVEDAAGRINLNQADPQLLRLALIGGGVDDAAAEAIAGAIVDWRDPDDQSSSGGSESAQYQQAGYPGVKNSVFDSPAELQQIPGITPQLAQYLAAITTTTMGAAGINPQVAAVPVLAAITGLDAATLNDYALQRSQALLDGTPPPPLPDNPASAFLAGGAVTGGGNAGTYHITVMAQAGSGAAVTAEITASTQYPPQGQAVRWVDWRFLP